MYFEMYQDTKKEWRWTLKADNGRKIADSGEGYINEGDCEAAINLIKASVSTARIRKPIKLPPGLFKR